MRRLPWFRRSAAARRPLVGVSLPELPLPELPRRAPRPIPVAASIGEGRLPHRPSGVRACGSGWCGQTPRSAAQCTGKPAAPRSGSELPCRIGPIVASGPDGRLGFQFRRHSGFWLLTPLAPLTPISRGDIKGKALGWLWFQRAQRVAHDDALPAQVDQGKVVGLGKIAPLMISGEEVVGTNTGVEVGLVGVAGSAGHALVDEVGDESLGASS